MKLKPEDVHSLTIIAIEPNGQFANLLMSTLEGKVLEVAQALRGEKQLDDLDESVRSAVEEFQHWAHPEPAAA